nr:SafA/ExsA family spore coat assembly protein [Metabacillus sediminilitoris]
MKIHIVQKGDTLWKIAKKYGVDFEELKSMNTQLSNPDLIMPGMKIKVPSGNPSGNVAIKKEAPMTMPAQKKEMPMVEHPFAKEKPKEVLGVEDTVPKEPIQEKPSKPYIPPVPNVQHPVYTGLDVNNYYTVNMAMMPQMAAPQLPPKPENVLPEMTKAEEDTYKEPAKEKPYYEKTEQQEEAFEEMANMPNISNIPNIPNMQMPAYTAPAMYQPYYCPPPYIVPVSPILPGSGLCPPGPYHPMPYGYDPAMMPNQPYPTAVSPAEYDEDENMAPLANQPYPQEMAPAQYGPGFPVNPYAGVPVSPVLPGSGYYPNQVLGAYNEDMDDDYDYENQAPAANMPYPQAVAPAYAPNPHDCGCGGPAQAQGYPHHQGFHYGYPMQQPFAGYPMQQPFAGYPMQQPFAGYPMQPMQQMQPQSMASQGYNPTQFSPQDGQLFGTPNFDDREEDED